MTLLRLVEVVVGLALVVVAAVAVSQPAYRARRVLLAVAVAAFAVGLIGVMDGLVR